MLENIKNEVKILMANNNDGHGFEHIERVYNLAIDFAQKEQADVTIVALAALLHDADDYKLFGQECADNLTNARKIMVANNVDNDMQEKVCDIINNMGYSKSLKGIRPKTLEGKIVSDADMLDAIGALGTIRCLAFALSRCDGKVFDAEIFPDLNLTQEEYKKPNRKSDNFINHFFEKLLNLKSMMFTASAKAEAKLRHDFMVSFLIAFFNEQGLKNWVEYLENYEKNNLSKVA